MRNGIMPLNNETLKHLKLRHPNLKKANKKALLSDIPERIHVVKIESNDVRETLTKSRGRSGPSEVDGDGWRHILLSEHLRKPSSDHFETLAKFAKKILAAEKSVSLELFLGLPTYNF